MDQTPSAAAPHRRFRSRRREVGVATLGGKDRLRSKGRINDAPVLDFHVAKRLTAFAASRTGKASAPVRRPKRRVVVA